jgi:hypothetical protein
MRYVYSVAAMAVLSFFVPAQATAQLTVANYRLVGTQYVGPTQSIHTLAADLVNTGAPRSAVTATVSSPVATLQTIPGSTNLHFAPAPTGTTPSLDTIKILVDTTVQVNYNQLVWSFGAPFAKAGPNQTVSVGATATLNGSGSSNPSGGYIQFSWQFLSRPPGSSARINNSSDAIANFIPDVANASWIVQLTVTNAAGSDVSVMTVTTANSAPVANAGPNQTVPVGALVTLNGSASSDADGDPLTFAWTLTQKPALSNATLSNPTSVSPTFTADRGGTYIAQLIVNDGKGHNSVASTVTINTQNTAPVANAGPAQSVNVGALVQLTGAGSTDVDGNPLTYAWSLISKPAGSAAAISNPTAVMPTFTVDLPGTYIAQLVVNDGQVNSAPATVTISTNASGPPTANAGPNQTVKHHSLVQLTGSGVDPQARPLTYLWSLVTKPNGSTAAINNPTAQNPTFTADLLGIYVAQLIVNNGVENSQPATVTITTTNTAPVANAGTNQTAAVGAVVTANGSFSSDADGDALTFAWTFTSKPAGSTANLQAPTSSTPTFVPDVEGTYVLQLIVSDVFASSVPATVTITVTSASITITPNPLQLFLNGPGNMTVTLNQPAPLGGLVVNLTSLNPSVATVPATVTVPANLLTATFVVTPLANGGTQITGASAGYRPGTATVNVGTPSITLSLSATTVGLTKSITGTVTLSAPAPPTGTTVNLNVAPAGIVSLSPSQVVIPGGQTTGTFNVTGVAVGSTQITGSAPGYSSSGVLVNAALLGQLSVEKNVTLAPGQTKPIQISLASPAPVGGVTITLVSSNTGAVVVSNTVTIPAGQTSPITPATVTGVAFGTATISASSSGYTGDSATVTVGSALTFNPSALNLAAGATQNLTLNISSAPNSNLTVNLTSSNAGAATVPASVVIAQNTTSVIVPVTGVNAGTTTITATSAVAGVTGTTALITVANAGGIQMPANSNVALGQSIPLQISLSNAAPAGGVTVNLSTSNAARATISAPTVFIAAGATTPAAQPTITGVGPGAATITATANGFGTANQAVTVTATLTLTPGNSSFPSGSSQNLTATLSGPAPAGGLTVNLSSSTPATASVPASVQIAAGATTAQFQVNGLVPGGATITAAATGVTSGTATVTVQNSGAILVSNVTVKPGQSLPLTITLPAPAASNTTITLVSSDTTKATLSPAFVTVLAGNTTPNVAPSVNGISFGSATITASAIGFGTGTGTATVGAALSFAQPTLNLAAGASQAMQLILSAVTPSAVPVTLTMNNNGVVSVASNLTIAQNSAGVNFQISGLAPGTTVITAATTTPNISSATLTVTVPGAQNNGNIGLPAGTSVSMGASTAFPVTLSTPAPAGGVNVSLASSDNTKLTIAPTTVHVPAGATQPVSQPQVTGVAIGTANITATAPNYNAAAQAVTVTGANVVTLTPGTLSAVLGSSPNLTATLPVAAPAGGTTINFSSSNAGAATVPASLIVPQGATSIQVPLTTVAAGVTTITATSNGLGQATSTVTVTNGIAINLPQNFVVGPGQNKQFPVTLASAPAVTTTVNLVSGDLAKMTFNLTSITFNAGQTTPVTQPTVTGIAGGTVSVNASGSGLANASTNVLVGYTLSFAQANLGIVGTATQNLTLNLSSAPPATVTVNLVSTNPGAATVPATANFTAGVSSISIPVTGVAPGSTMIKASNATIAEASANVTVSPLNAIIVPALTEVGLGKIIPFPVKLPTPAPPGGVTVTITSPDILKVIVQQATAFIAAGQTDPVVQPTILAENVGDVPITASAPGYTSASGVVKVGTTIYWETPFVDMAVGEQKMVRLPLGAAAPGIPPFPGDTGVKINFVSSNPAIVSLRDNVTAYPDGSEFTIIVVQLTAHAPGVVTITASGINIPPVVMTVNVGGPLAIVTTSLPNGTVGTPYSHTLAGGGGVAPRTWSLQSGTLPANLTLNPATGAITGIPQAAVVATPLTFRLTDSNNPAQSVNVALTLTILGGGGGGGNGTMTLTPSPLPVVAGATQNLTLTLSAAAPAGGLLVNVASSNTAIATVPATVTVGAGLTTASVQVGGVAVGSATVTATAVGHSQANATVNVTATPQSAIIVPALTEVGLGKIIPFPVKLPTPAPPGGVTVTITSPDILKVIVQQATAFIAAGQTDPVVQPTILAENVGDVPITASAPGYTSASGIVKVGTTIYWETPLVDMAVGQAKVVRLPLGAAAPGIPPFPGDTGVKINFVSSNPSIVSIRDSVTAYPDGSEFTIIVVVITAHAPGVATITASGINIPPVVMTVTVGGPLAITTSTLPNGTVGTPYTQTLLGGGGTSPRTWSLQSGTLPNGLGLNPNTGVISGTPTAPVNATPLTFRLTDSSNPVQNVNVSLTLTILSGGGGGNGTMTLTPSPLSIIGTATQNLTVTLSAPAPAGGLVVNLNSSNTAAATVPASVNVGAGLTTATVPVTGVAVGNTTVTAIGNGFGQASANVNVLSATGDIFLPQNLIVPPGDFRFFPVSLAAPSPGGTYIDLAVSNAAVATLSQTTIFINAGQTTPAVQPRLNGLTAGTVTVTATSFGLQNASTSARVGYGLTFTPQNVSMTGTGTQNVTLTLSSAPQSLVTVNLVSGNTGVATVVGTASFSPGSTTANVVITSVAPGNTTITASAPGIPDATATVTVAPPGVITVGPLSLGLGQTAELPISLSTPAPFGGLTLNLVSSQPGRVTVPATVTFAAGQTIPTAPVMATGVNTGNSTITATPPNSAYTAGNGVVGVNATVAWLAADAYVTQGTQKLVQLKLTAAAPWPANGGVVVNLTSANPAVAQAQASINFFPDGSDSSTVSINLTGVAIGTTTLTAEGMNIPAAVITVHVVAPLAVTSTTLANGSVGLAYSQQLAATGGKPSYSWAHTGGLIPDGLTLSPAGVLSGTPTTAVANAQFTVQVTDTMNPAQTANGTITLTITAQTPASIAIQGGNNQTVAVNSPFTPLSVVVKDAQDAGISGITVTFALPPSGASGAFANGIATAVTNGSGVATSAVLTSNSTIGNFDVVASVPGLGSTVTFHLSNIAGPPANIAVQAGSGQNAQTLAQFGVNLQAKVTDSGNNPVSGATVTFAPPVSGASGTFTGGNTAVTGANGIAIANAFTANGTAGTYVVNASAPGTGTVGFTLTNTSGPVTTVAAVGGTPQNGSILSAYALPLSALVSDQGGNPVPGVTVNFEAPATAASGHFNGSATVSAVTGSNGIAVSPTFTANGNTGTVVVLAKVTGVLTPASFNLTNVAGAPSSVTVSSGNSQSVYVNSTFGAPLAVLVKDTGNSPVAGATVTFTVPVSGPGGTFTTVNTAVTDANGIATSTLLKANAIAGTYAVTATTAGLPPATFNLTNLALPGTGPAITTNNVQLGKDLQQELTINLPVPLTAGQRITLTPTDYSKIRIVTSQGITPTLGLAQPLEVTGFEGLTTLNGLHVQALQSTGAAQILITGDGFTAAVVDVVLFPSGFILSGPNGVAGSHTVSQGSSAALTVLSARLDRSNNIAGLQPVRGGVEAVVNITSSTPSVGSANPPSVTLIGRQSSANTTFFANGSTGATTLTAVAPAGFTTPAGGPNVLAITVVPSSMSASNVTIGRNLQVSTRLALNSPVPGDPFDPFAPKLPMTITSSDPAKVLLSTTANGAGSASITLDVPAGRVFTQDFYIQGLDSGGVVSYSATAAGYGTASATVTLTPSAMYLFTPFGRGANFFTTSGALNSDLIVTVARLTPGLDFAEVQQLRGGFSTNVTVTSSNPAIGTITTSPVTIAGPNSTGNTQFDPLSVGTTVLEITQPAGFTSPVSGAAASVEVRVPTMTVNAVTVGKNLQGIATLLLAQSAPAGGLDVTLTSNSANLLLSNAQSTAGSSQIVIHINQGQSAAFFIPQAFTDTGSATYTVTAPGYQPTNGTVNFAKSGVIISSLFGPGASILTTVAAGNQPVTVSTAMLDNTTSAFVASQPLAAGLNLEVTLTNSAPAVGTIPATATINGGSSDASFSFTPLAVGNTNLGVIQPAGYTAPIQPFGSYVTLLARVNPNP